MATAYQNHPRPMGRSNVQQLRKKRAVSHPLPSTITNNPKGIKIRFGNNSSKNSMYKPTPILKRRRQEQPYIDHFNENTIGWKQPSNLESIPARLLYSPIRTPTRLRTIMTPPGIEPYRSTRNLRRFHSPLPGLDYHSAPIGLDTWGLDPSDYHLNSNLNLMRRYPSPLSHYGLGSALNRQKKPYIVVPRLNNLMSPPDSRGGGHFTLPYRRPSPVYVPDSHYTYLEQIPSFGTSRFQREPSDYVYVRRNEAFANHFIDDYIGRTIEDQLIPDILLEIIGELDQENKKQGDKSYRTQVDRYYAELNHRINHQETNNTHLYSDDWIRELDYQRPPVPSSKIDSNLSKFKPLDFKEIPPVRTTARLRYHDLPPDVQGRLLADINQELIDFEVENMVSEVTGQTLGDRSHNVSVTKHTPRNIYHHTEPEVVVHALTHDTANDKHSTQRNRVEHSSIEKYAQNKLLDTMCLDDLILKYIKQNGSVVDVDDLSRLLDATILGNLIYQYEGIDENRSRTLDNYATRKLHLNTFMNVTMDLLLTELSGSLIEDMKDVDEQERRKF